MKEWTFKVFIKQNGTDAFEDWISEFDADAEEKIRARLDFMSITRTWSRPYFDVLHGRKAIHEIIIKGRDKKQYRLLGCLGPGPQVFTILVGATKESKGGRTVWKPLDAPETAEKRRKLVFGDGRYVDEYNPRERNAEKKTKK